MIRRNFLIVLLCILFAPAFSFAQADNSGNGGGANGTGNTNAQGGNGGGGNGGGGNGGGGNGGGGNGGGQNGGGGGGGGRNFDPAQMRQRYEDMIKERLNASDDEWKIIQPKLEKVMDLQRQTRNTGGFGRMFGGRGGNRGDRNGGGGGAGGGPGGPQADNPTSQAMQDLNDTLDKKDATADEINQKLQAYRDARDKARKDLVDAQKDLQGVLEPRQEAVLVTFGMLD